MAILKFRNNLFPWTLSRKYKFQNTEAVYFVTFTTINRIDVFTRPIYKDIIVDSLNYCIKNKGLIIYARVNMSNHVHLVIESRNAVLEDCVYILKKRKRFKVLRTLKGFIIRK